MIRALVTAMLLAWLPQGQPDQATGVLHITVRLPDADGRPTPVPHHALLVSDNPASAAPRRIVTALDGTAEVRLRAGNYTVESDQPVVLLGKAYQWTQIVDVIAGRDAALELSAGNADRGDLAASSEAPSASGADESALLMQWQDSVVALWTPTAHASAFVVDARGLLATSQRAVGPAESVEVQLTPTVKVAGRVLASDADRDVAIVAVAPSAIAALTPVPLACGGSAPDVSDGQALATIGVPLRQPKGVSSATVVRVEPQRIASDFVLAQGSAGGPVFGPTGAVVGVTSTLEDRDSGRGNARIVRLEPLCSVLAAAAAKLPPSPPAAVPLPVEPPRPFPTDVLTAMVEKRAGSLSPYQLEASSFDVSFITPVMTFGAEYQSEQLRKRQREQQAGTQRSATRRPPEPGHVTPLLDFANWTSYVRDFPPVLLVRVTPRMKEGFWTTLARGAAYTQGVALPPIKHFTAGFLRLRAFCGEAEITPIHPFKLEQRLSETEAIYEGLYVFAPDAIGPQCATVRLELYSEKNPDKPESRELDPKLVQQIRADFDAYLAGAR